MENSSINIVICFRFQVMGIDDYLTLHAYIHSDPLPHTMRLLRDVVIVSAINITVSTVPAPVATQDLVLGILATLLYSYRSQPPPPTCIATGEMIVIKISYKI